MNDMQDIGGAPQGSVPAGAPQNSPIVIHNHMPKPPWLGRSLLRLLLFVSIFANIVLIASNPDFVPEPRANEKFLSGEKKSKDKIAVIRMDEMITGETIKQPKKELEYAADDRNVRAVVLAVSSPGGTISASDELYHAIEAFKAKTKKPVVVWMTGMATSGAYYISMPADQIFAERSCVTGSIGVILSLFDLSKLAADWGIKPETVKSGKMKDSGSFLKPLTEEERAEWQKMIDAMYAQFLEVILKHRSGKIGGEDKLRGYADGRVYIAQEALDLGLIDNLGYQEDALAAAAKHAGLELDKVRVITYQRPYDSFLEVFGGRAASPAESPFQRFLEAQMPQFLLLPRGIVGYAK
ncbi:MAG: signal peptide peptidase SppA [Planctomycetota bacterium]